jgi:hypothetical protein
MTSRNQIIDKHTNIDMFSSKWTFYHISHLGLHLQCDIALSHLRLHLQCDIALSHISGFTYNVILLSHISGFTYNVILLSHISGFTYNVILLYLASRASPTIWYCSISHLRLHLQCDIALRNLFLQKQINDREWMWLSGQGRWT